MPYLKIAVQREKGREIERKRERKFWSQKEREM